MQAFPLQQLQRKHPQAFYQRLIFSQLKLTHGYHNPLVWMWSFILSLVFSLPLLLISTLLSLFWNTLNPNALLNVSLLIWMSLTYLLLAFAKYQAHHSSIFYASFLQKKLQMLTWAALAIGLNHFSIQSETLSLVIFIVFCLPCLIGNFIEIDFKHTSTAIERIRLHKLRQFAYWAHLESKKQSPQMINGVDDLKSYYQQLQQAALTAESQLSLEIKKHRIP